VPLATIEFAILDMFGKMSGKSIGQLIGEIHNARVAVYQANGERDISAEETIEHMKRDVAISHAKAIKFQAGRQDEPSRVPAGRSEKLIPLVRKTFGDRMVISADANGSYTPRQAIPIGKPDAGVQLRVLRGAGALRLVRGDQAGCGRAEDSHRGRRAGTEHAQLPLADRKQRPLDCAAGYVLLRRHGPVHESGEDG